MPDAIGNIYVPEIVASGTFPIIPEYPHGRASHPDVAIHQFGSGNAKIEQRFLLGTGARRFTVRRAWMNDTQRLALRNFWEMKYGPYGAFTYNAPNDDGSGTTAFTCRFANEPLSWQMVAETADAVTASGAAGLIRQNVAGLVANGQYTFYVWLKVPSGPMTVSIGILDNGWTTWLVGEACDRLLNTKGLRRHLHSRGFQYRANHLRD